MGFRSVKPQRPTTGKGGTCIDCNISALLNKIIPITKCIWCAKMGFWSVKPQTPTTGKGSTCIDCNISALLNKIIPITQCIWYAKWAFGQLNIKSQQQEKVVHV